jgi:predicted Holliday junction resolvase-like endonuclease
MIEREILLTILFLLATVALVIVVLKFFRLKSELPTKVREQYEAFRNSELQALTQQYQQIAQKEATVQFEQWARAKEEEIRKDAINRSRVVTIGKVSEQVVPFTRSSLITLRTHASSARPWTSSYSTV